MVQRGRIVRVRMLEARFASLKPTYFPNASFTTASRVSSLMAFAQLQQLRRFRYLQPPAHVVFHDLHPLQFFLAGVTKSLAS